MEDDTQFVGFWEWEPDSGIVRLSEGFASFLHLPPAALIVKRDAFLEFIRPEDREICEASLLEVFRTGKPQQIRHGCVSSQFACKQVVTRMERLPGTGGDKASWRVAGAVLLAGGEASRAVGLSLHAKNIIEAAPIGIVVIDEKTHHIMDINETGARLIGLPKDSIIGKACHRFMCPAEMGKCPITDLDQEIDDSERILLTHDSAPIPILKTVIRASLEGRRCLVEIIIDNRARKEAELKLRERDSRLAEAEQWAKFGTWEWDIAQDKILLSDGFRRILEAGRDSFSGGLDDLIAYVHPHDREEVRTLIHRAIERIFPLTHDIRFLLHHGGERIFFVHAGCTFDAFGRPDRLVGIVQDVTNERQRAENFLTQNEFLTTVIESFAQPFYVIDAKNYSIVYANSFAVNTIGEDWMNLTCYEWTHKCKEPCTGKDHVCPLVKVRETGKGVVTEHQHYDRDGIIRHYAVYGYPIFDAMGEFVQMIEFTRDITQRKKMSMALHRSEDRYRNLSREFNILLDAIPDRIMLVSPQFKILWANRWAQMDFVAKAGDTTDGQFCYSMWGETTPCKDCPVVKALQTGKVAEAQISTPDGKFWELRAIPIVEKKGVIAKVVEIAHDITDRITLQADALRTGHLASLGELAAGVAHEINNPINSIINFAQILSDEMEQQGRATDIPGWIMKEGDRVAAIVHSLLSFARQRDTDDTIVRIHEVIAEALALTSMQLKKDGIKLDLDVAETLPGISGSFQKIQQVFLNIINNARYALNKRHPTVSAEKVLQILARAEEEDGRKWVRITFYDQGSGIPEHIIDKVTLPFFSTKPADRGTGLGLTISHNIIKEHGGKLMIRSEEGRYTEMVVLLPAVSG